MNNFCVLVAPHLLKLVTGHKYGVFGSSLADMTCDSCVTAFHWAGGRTGWRSLSSGAEAGLARMGFRLAPQPRPERQRSKMHSPRKAVLPTGTPGSAAQMMRNPGLCKPFPCMPFNTSRFCSGCRGRLLKHSQTSELISDASRWSGKQVACHKRDLPFCRASGDTMPGLPMGWQLVRSCRG